MIGRSDETLLRTMLDQMRHRGPDDLGVHLDDHMAIGQTRLSIIDVKGGKQPIYNEEGDGLVVCNGEIYNHQALRARLTSHSFRTRSDTETVLHLFEDKREKAVDFLDGMFAFAVTKGGNLLLARDRLGVKPLYYAEDDGVFYFASEMKGLLKATDDIHEFPPGHYYTCSNGFQRYYSIPDFQDMILTQEEAIQKIREELVRAVENRLMSDVPVGVYLSGGLDSSIVAALAKKTLPELYTFSVGVRGSRDLEHAALVAEHLGTNHHQYVYGDDEVIEILRDVIYFLESFDFALVRSAIPNFFVSRLARGIAKVILTGEGADEVFSGYDYLKQIPPEQLHQELWRITSSLHNLNLQRTDRMTMAHSIEGRVPFLDTGFLNLASGVPLELKLGPERTEKWILRAGFKDTLPPAVVWRKKEKFSQGAGSMLYLKSYAEKQITDRELEKEREGKPWVRSKEELLYFRIFSEFYPEHLVRNLGQTRDVDAL